MATCSQPQLNQILYEQDFYLWIQTTAQLLKERRFEDVEWSNLIEEIESMGRSEKKELKSRLIVLIEHLLKMISWKTLLKLMDWKSEKADNYWRWRNTIVEQRRQICLSIEDSPSLRSLLADMFLDSYHIVTEDALRKYQLPSRFFPVEPPFTLEDVLNSDYLPE